MAWSADMRTAAVVGAVLVPLVIGCSGDRSTPKDESSVADARAVSPPGPGAQLEGEAEAKPGARVDGETKAKSDARIDDGAKVEPDAEPGPGEWIRADDRLRHPTLGVSVPDPGPKFEPWPKMDARTPPPMRSTTYFDFDTASMLILLVAPKAPDAEKFESSFEKYLDGFLARNDESKGFSLDNREHWVRWSERRAVDYTIVNERQHRRTRAFSLDGPSDVYVVTVSLDEDLFASLSDRIVVP